MNELSNDIDRYLRGEMSPQEMHALERRALDDPFLADALEGAGQIDSSVFASDVSELKREILKPKKSWLWWSSRIAAAVILLIAATVVLWPTDKIQSISKDLALQEKSSAEASDETQTATAKEEQPEVTGEEKIAESKIEKKSNVATQKPEASGAGQKDPLANLDDKERRATASPTIAETEPAEFDLKSDTIIPKETLAGVSNIKNAPIETIKTEEPTLAKANKITEAESAREDSKQDDIATRSAIVDKDIARKKMAQPSQRFASDARKISGTITSSEDGAPIPGVNIMIKGTTIGTVTDISGHYEISVPEPNSTLLFSFIGFETYEKTIPSDQAIIDATLRLDTTQLSEVVVTGYSRDGQADESTLELAHPEIGFQEFKKYLERNIKYPEQAIENKVEGRVMVEFTVESNGSLTGFNVVRGIGSGCDEELIRLIKESKWVPTRRNSMPVTDKARVRLKFDLPK